MRLGGRRGDPRRDIHALWDDPTEERPSAWMGDAKSSGRAIQAERPDRPRPPASWFRIDIDEVVLTSVSDPPDYLVIESWHPGRGLRRQERQ